MTYLKLIFFSVLTLSTTLQASNPANLDDAKKLAKEKGAPVLIDFFTVWCGPCKSFSHDSKTDADIKKALEQVILFKVDSEKGNGPALAKEYKIQGYPTYALITAKGEVITRWVGYSKDFFLSSLNTAMKNPIPFSEKITSFEKKPTAELAESIADFYASSGDATQAVTWFKKAGKLNPDTSYAPNLFELNVMSMRSAPDAARLKELQDLITQAVSAKKTNGEKLLWNFNVMFQMNQRLGNMEHAINTVKTAYEYGEKQEGGLKDAYHKAFYPLYLVYVSKTPDKGAEAYKETLPKDWDQTSQGLNNYAWWCFSNKANMKDGLAMAAKGASLAQSGREKAMILDTQAELENALGNPQKAADLSALAVKEDAHSRHYPQQVQRFKDLIGKK